MTGGVTGGVTGGEQPVAARVEVGVGPWLGPPPDPQSPLGRHADPVLLRDGDRRNVVDAYRYWRHDAIVADLLCWAAGEGLPLVGVDNQPGSRPIEQFELPHACVLVFGQEGPGLTPQALEACATTVSIAQFGSTRSLNAGAAAAIAMHAWVRTHADLATAWRPSPPPADPPAEAGLV